MAKHARLSASSAERWMTCPGSVPLSDGVKDEGSSYADEGTAAHHLASVCLKEGKDAKEFKGRKICLATSYPTKEAMEFFEGEWEAAVSVGTITVRDKIEVDTEMVKNVQKYLDDVRRVTASVDGTLLVEQRLSIHHLTGEDSAEGTSDTVIVGKNGTLVVVDLKYGQGEAVDATDNKQLLTYVSAANEAFSLVNTFDDFHAVIHQPRLNSVSGFMFRPDVLATFEADAKEAANRVEEATIVFANKGDMTPFLKASEKGCRWCKVKATCPTLQAFVEETVGADMQDLSVASASDVAETAKPAEPPSDEDLQALATKALAIPQIEAWIKAVRGAIEGLLFAGVDVPGWKLVQGKQGNRKWSDEEEVLALMKKMKLRDEQIFDKKLLTPPKVEELLGEDPKKWDRLLPLITRSEGSPSVAPATDKRPALVLKPVDDEMVNLTEEVDLLG